jgi:hypothetical protein
LWLLMLLCFSLFKVTVFFPLVYISVICMHVLTRVCVCVCVCVYGWRLPGTGYHDRSRARLSMRLHEGSQSCVFWLWWLPAFPGLIQLLPLNFMWWILPKVFLFKIYFIRVCVCVCVCVCVRAHACGYLWRPKKATDVLAWIYRRLWATWHACWTQVLWKKSQHSS